MRTQNEMELDESRDGIVTFPEFLAWYNTDSAMKKAGSMAFKLQKAKESAYAKELGPSQPARPGTVTSGLLCCVFGGATMP